MPQIFSDFTLKKKTNRDEKRFFYSGKLPTLNHASIIVQRTTSVEQKNRIFADVINPNEFAYPIVSENNTSVCCFESMEDALYCLGILNSTFADFYLRLFNSNTHISSSELNRIPIPVVSDDLKYQIVQQVKVIKSAIASRDNIEKNFAILDDLVFDAFRLKQEDIDFIKKRYNSAVQIQCPKNTTAKQSSKKVTRQVCAETTDDYLD